MLLQLPFKKPKNVALERKISTKPFIKDSFAVHLPDKERFIMCYTLQLNGHHNHLCAGNHKERQNHHLFIGADAKFDIPGLRGKEAGSIYTVHSVATCYKRTR